MSTDYLALVTHNYKHIRNCHPVIIIRKIVNSQIVIFFITYLRYHIVITSVFYDQKIIDPSQHVKTLRTLLYLCDISTYKTITYFILFIFVFYRFIIYSSMNEISLNGKRICLKVCIL